MTVQDNGTHPREKQSPNNFITRPMMTFRLSCKRSGKMPSCPEDLSALKLDVAYLTLLQTLYIQSSPVFLPKNPHEDLQAMAMSFITSEPGRQVSSLHSSSSPVIYSSEGIK
jgi:hypothetical protein